MGVLRFIDDVQCGFDALDQDERIKRSTVMRLVMDGYGRAPGWDARSRGDYMQRTGLSPITAYIELIRQPYPLHVDQQLQVQFASTYGFVPGRDGAPPRYGGSDRIEVVDEGDTRVAVWRQHWFWHRVGTGELLHEPAPGVPVEQDEVVEAPPRRPRLERAEDRRGFRWTARETDANQHINALGYLERAENALADTDGMDAEDASDVRLWFRRPTFLTDAMVAAVGEDADTLLVELRRAEPEELCATLAFA